jgi:hypothetical protein
VGGTPDGCSKPKSERQRLARALAASSLDSGKPQGVPLDYALEALARRWGIPPWELENAPDAEWIIRGMHYMKVEAEAQASAYRARSKKRG